MSDFKCNKCKEEIDIHEHELFELFTENNHEIECPYCQTKIYINSVSSYSFFVTDEEGEEIY